MRLSLSQKFILSTGLFAALVGIFIWGFWRLQRNIAHFTVGLEEASQKVISLERERRDARRTGSLLLTREKELEPLIQFFVDRERPVAFLEHLEEVARRTRNTLAVDVGQEQQDESALALRLTIEGNRKSLLQYLKLLELMPYQITVEDIAFQDISGGASARSGKQTAAPSAQLLISIRVKTKISS